MTSQRVELHVPTATILKLIFTVGVVWLVLRLWPELVFLCFSFFFAIALAPVVSWGERRGLPRWIAVAILAASVLGAVTAFSAFVVPTIVSQVTALVADLPGFHARLLDRFAPSPTVEKLIARAFELPQSPEALDLIHRPIAIGVSAVSGATTLVLTVVVTLYFLVDGKRLYAWLLAYVPRRYRSQMAETAPAVSKVVSAFVRGQLIVCTLFAAYAVVVLSVLRVPAVLPLALLAFVCDVIPVVGIIIATVPTLLLALTDSPAKAVAVAILFFGYHMFETYVIIPRVYGSAMRLSTLTVLLALVIGASLQGVVGAILALPIVATYPSLERIWLKGYLSDDVIRDHAALDRAIGVHHDAVIDAVIRGQTARARARRYPLASRSLHRWRRARLARLAAKVHTRDDLS